MVSLCAGVPAHCGRSRGVDGEGDADPGATSTRSVQSRRNPHLTGEVPAFCSLGGGQEGQVREATSEQTYRSVSVVWPGKRVTRLQPDQAPATGLFGFRSCRQQMLSPFGASILWVWFLVMTNSWVET